jgi:DNA-directed RNA polymerase subunit E'/Rpb7
MGLSTSTVSGPSPQHSGVPLTVVLVECRMVVFRPFKGEVIVARIASQSREGINRMFCVLTKVAFFIH